MNGRLIVIEGTDCSGKETQANLLMEVFKKQTKNVCKFSFPDYNAPTGKIIGGPYLGKEYICKGWFPEGAPSVDAKVASLYYAADRYYHLKAIRKKLEEGYVVLLDRYTYSNMAHQCGKIKEKEQRLQMFNWIAKLEFEMLELPIPDIRIFLHMPVEASNLLKKSRAESADEHEKDSNHLLQAEHAYLEIAQKFDFLTIECAKKKENITLMDIKTPDEIHQELLKQLNLI